MKKSYIIFTGLISILMLTACSQTTPTEPQTRVEVSNFEECIVAGNPVMESYPRQCSHEGKIFVEAMEQVMVDGQEDIKPCTREYQPVCGEIQVQCITTPCPPLRTTFANRCEAENAGAIDITEGACMDSDVNLEGACLSFDGTWLEASQECEGMGQEQCENLGGTFNECASACRNNPEAEICTLQCVIVCQF